VLDSRNYSERQAADNNFLAAEYERLKKSKASRINSGNQILYYKESRILTLLKVFPYVQMLLIGFFVTFGYFSFSSARRSEQNQVWAGMAKETAHQLGTPISAILGWMDLLETTKADDLEVQDVVLELRNDVGRLELITDRFSKIGSSPELTKVNLYEVLHESKEYMQRRAPRRIEFIFPALDTYPPYLVPLNVHLFAWVIENLIRNALDAMDNKGIIAVNLYEDHQYVNVEVSDTGKGIPASKWKTVFQPGYSTKKRGWGLGLSLAKRIIEEYHKGKIFVKESKEDVGTTFTIRLPKV
jgi:signal transduction histidine kinase